MSSTAPLHAAPRLKPIGSNITELTIGDVTILYSYQTPVAAHVAGVGFYRTARRYSVTTSRHINKWLKANGSGTASEVVQPAIDGLAAGLPVEKCIGVQAVAR